MISKIALIAFLALTFAIIGPGATLFASDVDRVTNIGSNGTSEGDAYRVKCTSGNEYVIERRKGKWHSGTVFSDLGKSASDSADSVAKYICNSHG
ncbi:MAG: hypothetical protein LBF40_06230 [Deltaproteobacteria bacterium]|jgi:hypothetical protein|nr:hypothetical protein [Deltaproteobacteria bacterium]